MGWSAKQSKQPFTIGRRHQVINVRSNAFVIGRLLSHFNLNYVESLIWTNFLFIYLPVWIVFTMYLVPPGLCIKSLSLVPIRCCFWITVWSRRLALAFALMCSIKSATSSSVCLGSNRPRCVGSESTPGARRPYLPKLWLGDTDRRGWAGELFGRLWAVSALAQSKLVASISGPLSCSISRLLSCLK